MEAVLERDRSQAETVLSLEQYIAMRLTPRVIGTARDRFAKYRHLIEQIGTEYSVPPALIVSVWGSESDFGRLTGTRPTIGALATLAYDQRRSSLFRRELFSALEILNRGDIELASMKGSWAGAMGQPQFMPSSYLAFAEDFDGDGRRDIWDTPADVFASIANYLKGHGWESGMRWGHEVRIPSEAASQAAAVSRRNGSCRATREMTVAVPLKDWREMGVRLTDGRPLPDGDQMASLVSGTTRHFLVYENYDALLSYNCAHAYALSVALLSDRLANP
jgi:membrane-bound lytic murein transglycosylase B